MARSLTVCFEEGRRLALTRDGACFIGQLQNAEPGLRYQLSVDGGRPFPDPFSRDQPEGIDGPSALVTADFPWTDAGWSGLAEEGQVLYELHVGTATSAGTFEALIPRLAAWKELGITALELMPVATFPGTRNWGYDGVFPFAPQASYGGPTGLRRLVDAAHTMGLGVLLDVVFNHLGPEGNRLGALGPYSHPEQTTPWGAALDFDGPAAPLMRGWALDAVTMWIRDFHLDGLRLDATHAIRDASPQHLLAAIRDRAVAAAPGRRVLVIAEDGLNREHLTRPREAGGVGLSMQWSDDFHHVVHRLITGASQGVLRDMGGGIEALVHVLRRGWLHEGAPSVHHGCARGTDASSQPPHRFVFFLQNHDQIGNRAHGERLSELVSHATVRALTALLLLAPQTPLLFMGQEWGEQAPFLYFTDLSPALGQVVRAGRRREAEALAGHPLGALPDPQSPGTFVASRISEGPPSPAAVALRELHRVLLEVRRTHPAFVGALPDGLSVRALGPRALELSRATTADASLTLVLNLEGPLTYHPPSGQCLRLSSEDRSFGGRGASVASPRGSVHLHGPEALVWTS